MDQMAATHTAPTKQAPDTAAAAIVSLKGAGVFRSGRWLVRGIDVDIRPGEILTLIGPNGSGKSTTAKMVLGINKTDEGSAWRAPGLVVGYVPQKLSIDWTLPLSVERFMRLTQPLSKSEINAALTRTGVAHLAKSAFIRVRFLLRALCALRGSQLPTTTSPG